MEQENQSTSTTYNRNQSHGRMRGRIGWSHRINDSEESHWTYGGPLKATKHSKYKEILRSLHEKLPPGSYFELLYVAKSPRAGKPPLCAYRVDPISGSRSVHEFDGTVWKMIRMQAGWYGRETWMGRSVADFFIPFDPARLNGFHPNVQIVIHKTEDLSKCAHEAHFQLGVGDLLQLVCDNGRGDDIGGLILGSPWYLKVPNEEGDHCVETIDGGSTKEVMLYGSEDAPVTYAV
ncbi:hypothetical protein FRC17_007017 [Serendipita sp. 399]|nr:hypothetical protein FRC17_007017 [Serendipita sp. 399]